MPVVRAFYDWHLSGAMGLLQIRDRLKAAPTGTRRRSRPSRRRRAVRGAGPASGSAAQPQVRRLPGLEPP
ncbi:MAG: hypothetical protein ACYDES_01655, partial [Acidimicrobiales bacterium]